MVAQFFLMAASIAGFVFAWGGVDRSEGWRIAVGSLVALIFLGATFSLGPTMKEYGECERFSSFAESC
ncbi:hypothetical protein [Brucella sp. IR073]|uniref:hypothetical protein n=1 Tax=unclassified Brucella TaxID=2632610 RepID=UPI003B984E0D